MKKVIKSVVFVLCCFLLTACKQDLFEGIDIYATSYPVEYIVNQLYGEHSNISSIYPSGVNIEEYTLNDKQIKDYSKTDLFLFDGTTSEKEYVAKFFKYNKDLKIIDVTASMESFYGYEELWLDPSNLLMIAQNIRYGLKEYINNHYLKNEIDEKYNKLKEKISKLDANLYALGSSATNKTIVSSSDLFKYLEKYGINVISLEDADEKTYSKVSKLIESNTIHYIFVKNGIEVDEKISKFANDNKLELVSFHTLANLTGEERNAKKDYDSIMNENIELLRNELFS